MRKIRKAVWSPGMLGDLFPDYLGHGSEQLLDYIYAGPGAHAAPQRNAVPGVVPLRPEVLPPSLCAYLGELVEEDRWTGPPPNLAEDSVGWEVWAGENGYKSVFRAKTDVLHRPLTEEDMSRQRFRYSADAEYLELLGPRFGPGIGMWVRISEPRTSRLLKAWVLQALRNAFPRGINRESVLRKYLKKVGSFSKVNGDFLPGWKGLISLNELGGFVPAPPSDDFVEDVTAWVSGPPCTLR